MSAKPKSTIKKMAIFFQELGTNSGAYQLSGTFLQRGESQTLEFGQGSNQYSLTGHRNSYGSYKGRVVDFSATWSQVEEDSYQGVWIEGGGRFFFEFLVEEEE